MPENNKQHLEEAVEGFFLNEVSDEVSKSVQNIFLRQDGGIVYSNIREGVEHSSTIAAVVCGVWQGMHMLALEKKIVQKEDTPQLFFISGENGIVVSNINRSGEIYLLVSLYNKILNPGKIRYQIKLLAKQMQGYLSTHKNNRDDPKERPREELASDRGDQEKANPLFGSISDAEIDNLFGEIGA